MLTGNANKNSDTKFVENLKDREMYQLVNLCFNDIMQNMPGMEDHSSVTNYFSENLMSYSGCFLCYQHYNRTGTHIVHVWCYCTSYSTFPVLRKYFLRSY